jgi:hypothetical protein
MKIASANVRTFVPERWNEGDFFKKFYAGTHHLKPDATKALNGVSNHFRKASILYGLAIKILPNMQIDEQELISRGHTSAINGAELSAVLEEVFTELYASVECVRKVITSIYAGAPKLPTDSTRRFFDRVSKDEVGPPFPPELVSAVKSCHWYAQLRVIRDELTHADIGHCTLDREKNTITYLHRGIKGGGSAFVLKDVMEHIDVLAANINDFIEAVFRYLNAQLVPIEVDEVCGFFNGRVYMRKLPHDRSVNFHSGKCASFDWFDKTEGFRCPFADNCGAYHAAQKENVDSP